MIRIAHASDIQVRNFQRHDEFRKHFDNFYSSLSEKKPDLITLVGDIFHSKIHIAPESVQLVAEFLRNLSEIAPLIIVPGNHDGCLNNLSRLDSITPIVNALQDPKIKYFKHSGVYPINTKRIGETNQLVDSYLNIVVFSCFDDNWPKQKDINSLGINIGLYHGMVKNAILQNGQKIEDCPYSVKDFLRIVDYVFMGDIHKMQFLDFKQKSAYCGSLLQQNFGEGLNKGYLLWDIEDSNNHEVDFIKLPNICPYYIIDMPDDLLLTEDLPIQQSSRIRVDSRSLTPTEESVLRKKIVDKYNPVNITFKDDINAHKQNVKIAKDVKIEDLSDLGIQEKLFRKFFENDKIEESIFIKICELNKKYDFEIRRNDNIIRNVQYKFGKMWWKNMLSYGEDNVFDFSKQQGLVGVFGGNGTGKSALVVDIPLYAMLNSNTKGVVKNDHLINDKKDSCQVIFDLHVGNSIHKIDRSTKTYIKKGKRKGKPVYQGETKLFYTKCDLDGNVILSLNDEQRQTTDKELRKVFGTLEDIRATSIAAQFDLLNFINKKDTERQKIIGRYFDVDIFEKKRVIASEDCKELKGALKVYSERNFLKEKEDVVILIKKIDELIKCLNVEIVECDEELKIIECKMQKVLEKITKVSFDESKDENILSEEIKKKKCSAVVKKSDIDNLKLEIDKLQQRLDCLFEKNNNVNIGQYEKELYKLKNSIKDVNDSEVVTCTALICEKDKNIEELKKYPCIKNVNCGIRKEIKRIEKEISNTTLQQKTLVEKLEHYRDVRQNKIIPLENTILEYYSTVDELSSLTKKIKSQNKFLEAQQELFDRIVEDVKNLEEQKDIVVKYKQITKQNNEYRQIVDKIKKDRYDLELKRDKLRDVLVRNEVERDNLWKKYSEIEKDEKVFVEFKKEYDAYFYFLEAVGKNGLSRVIINENLQIINTEIAKILSGKVNFVVELEADSSGKIEIYFKTLKSKKRKIELCSGMEKTISAIAIRAALVNITTLPKANVFILDEVFTALDAEYLDATREILQYLKNMFDSVIIITHIEELRDFVDNIVEVCRDEQGFSRVLQ